MDRRDRELLDKQLRVFYPRRDDGIMFLTVVAVFFAGVALGGVLFPHQNEAKRITPSEVVSFLNNAPPTLGQ